jgi:hypothetical protein
MDFQCGSSKPTPKSHLFKSKVVMMNMTESGKHKFNADQRTGCGYPAKLLVIPAILILAQLLVALLNSGDFVNYDCAYYFLGAKLLLEGKKPLLDFVDLLPPIILYLSVPPIWFSQAVIQPIATVWSLTVWTTVAITSSASVLILRSANDVGNRDWLCIGPLMCSFLLFNLVLGFHFGQREHIFVLVFFPMFLIRWLRWTQPQAPKIHNCLASICGCACAIAVFVKPQFLLLPLALEFYFLLRSRHRLPWHKLSQAREPSEGDGRPRLFGTEELVSFLITSLACLIGSCFIPNIDTYYSRWVPLVSQGYGAFFSTNPELMLFFVAPDGQLLGSRLLALVVVAAAFFLSRRSVLIGALLVWTVAGLILYLVQGRGWSYQSIPAVCGYFLLSNTVVAFAVPSMLAKISTMHVRLSHLSPSLLVAESVSVPNQTRAKVSTVVFLIYGLLLLPLSTLLVHNSSATATTLKSVDCVIESQTKVNDTIVILHTLLPNAHQAQLRLNREPGCRYVWCFPLRMIAYMKLKQSMNISSMESLIVSEIIQDIQKSRPKLIAIEAFASDASGWTLYKSLLAYDFSNRALRDYEPIGCINKLVFFKRKENETAKSRIK